MITQVGKGILARKLSGITDSCFDYLAVGIGARPSPNASITGAHLSAPLTALRHEVLRVPVVSALPTDSGSIKCVAELPSSFVCEFTEVGLWTHKENAGSGRPQSQQLATFTPSENWKSSDGPLLKTIVTGSGEVDYLQHNALTEKAAVSPYDDILWTVRTDRRVRKEGFRLGSHGIVVKGDISNISGASPDVWTFSNRYVSRQLNGLPFDSSATVDELSLAYFVSTNDQGSTTAPGSIKLSVQFVTSDGKYAKWNVVRTGQSITLTPGVSAGATVLPFDPGASVVRRGDYVSHPSVTKYPTEIYPTSSTSGDVTFSLNAGTLGAGLSVNAFDLSTTSSGNCYYTDYTQLQETSTSRSAIVYDAGFKWANVVEMRVYANAGSSHWIGLDSLTFTNVDKMNSSYGLVAYDVAFNYETRGIQTKVNSPTNVMFEVQVV